MLVTSREVGKGILQLITVSALRQLVAVPKQPGPHTRRLCTHFWSSLPQLVGTRVGNENFVLQIMGILCSNHQLLLLIMRCRKRWEATVPTPTAI